MNIIVTRYFHFRKAGHVPCHAWSLACDFAFIDNYLGAQA